MIKPTDEMLATQLINGQAKAFEQIYKRYEKKIMGYAYSKLKNTEAAEEVFQVVWEKVYKSIHKFDPSLNFSSWIFNISSNAINDHFRSNSKVTVPLDLAQHDLGAEADLKPQGLIDIEELESPYKEVLNYKYVEGLTTKEISTKMSLTDANVRKILSRGRDILRDKIGGKK